MAEIKLKGNPIHTKGDLPSIGSTAPDFSMVKNDLSEVTLHSLKGHKYKVLNIFPSIDTGTCATSVRQFNQKSATLGNTFVLNLSVDLPFAQKRFCGAEGIDKTETFSLFRSDFTKNYHLQMTDGPLKGLCSRAVILLDENNKVLYTEQVSDIVNEPNYDALIAKLK
jgi:thioredoxin-dependent peroxiredoxin